LEIEKVIGENIRRGREANGWTQPELGALLEEYLGEPWSRQVVFNAEKGLRGFKAAELVALAVVLNRSVPLLFEPVDPEEAVSFGRYTIVRGSPALAVLSGRQPGSKVPAVISSTADDALRRLDAAEAELRESRRYVEAIARRTKRQK
jgi:transcriptional regulator with XRE-family HTH domain